MMAKRGRRGEDGTTELSKPVPESSERALVNKSSNAMDEIKTHSCVVKELPQARFSDNTPLKQGNIKKRRESNDTN